MIWSPSKSYATNNIQHVFQLVIGLRNTLFWGLEAVFSCTEHIYDDKFVTSDEYFSVLYHFHTMNLLWLSLYIYPNLLLTLEFFPTEWHISWWKLLKFSPLLCIYALITWLVSVWHLIKLLGHIRSSGGSCLLNANNVLRNGNRAFLASSAVRRPFEEGWKGMASPRLP